MSFYCKVKSNQRLFLDRQCPARGVEGEKVPHVGWGKAAE